MNESIIVLWKTADTNECIESVLIDKCCCHAHRGSWLISLHEEVLDTVAAFLLVSFIDDVTIFKMVYMLFLFIACVYHCVLW